MQQPATETPGIVATAGRVPGWQRLPEAPPSVAFHDDEPDRDPPGPGGVIPPAPQRHETRGRGGWLQTIVAAFLGAALAVAGLQIIDGEPTETATDATSAPVASAAPEVVQPPAAEPTDVDGIAALAESVVPSIVTVNVGGSSSGTFVSRGSGSGVIIDEQGYIVTNDHVVGGGSAYEVVLSDGRTTYDATLIGTDPLTDLAVLHVDATGLRPIELGSTETLRVGDRTVAIGSPLGLLGGPSLTVGVVSALGRQVSVSAQDTLFGMLQTDAPITQGSSGGALVDSQGRLIGITTAVGVSSVGIEGIGFATPVEMMERVVEELLADGSVDHAFLGIVGQTRFATAADGARIAVGVVIDSVEQGSAAAEAGLTAGDVITAIDGEPVTTMDDLIVALRYKGAGDATTLDVSDDGGARTVPITLGVR